MKKYITILLVVFAFGQAMAQDEKPPIKLRTEIGLQANALFGRLLNDENDDSGLAQNPYLLTGKIIFGNIAVRVGVGGNHDKEIQRVEGFANSITVLNQGLDLRLGAERRFALGGRWQGNLGIDAVAQWSQDKTVNDSGFDVITDTHDVQYIGGGLSTGIKFQATERLSFGTEGYLYYTVGKTTDGEFFKNFPVGEDKINKSDISGVKIGLPSALYLILEF